MRRIALLMLPLLVLPAPLAAAPLNKGEIPADAKWVIHADLEGFLASKVGTAVLGEARKQGLDAALGAVQAMFAVDLTKDLKSVAVFGTDFKETQGVVLIHAKLDRDKMLAILKANPGYGESNYGDHVVYRWREKAKGVVENEDGEGKAGSARCGCFWGDDVALIAQDAGALKHAVDVLDRKADSLAKEGVAGPLPALAKGAWIVGGVTDLGAIAKARTAAGEAGEEQRVLRAVAKGEEAAFLLFRKVSAASLQLGEGDDAVFLSLSVTAADARTAANLRRILDGLLGFVDLAADVKSEGKPAIPAELAEAVRNAKVSGEDRAVQFDLAVPVKDVLSLLQWVIDQRAAKARAAAAADRAGTEK